MALPTREVVARVVLSQPPRLLAMALTQLRLVLVVRVREVQARKVRMVIILFSTAILPSVVAVAVLKQMPTVQMAALAAAVHTIQAVVGQLRLVRVMSVRLAFLEVTMLVLEAAVQAHQAAEAEL